MFRLAYTLKMLVVKYLVLLWCLLMLAVKL